jgi:tetratricopeptide (TPR) repeat protein
MDDRAFLETIDVMIDAGHWDEVIAAIESRLQKGSPSHELLWNIGWAHLKVDQYTKAASYLRKAIELGPPSHVYYGALGVSLLKIEEYDDAELWLLRALALRDTYLTRISLALAYHKQGLIEMAEAVHTEGIRAQPNHRGRLEAYADFLGDIGRDEESERVLEQAEKLSDDD